MVDKPVEAFDPTNKVARERRSLNRALSLPPPFTGEGADEITLRIEALIDSKIEAATKKLLRELGYAVIE